MNKSELLNCVGFDWDEYNSYKNWKKYLVTMDECEEIFFNQPLIVFNDIKHSKSKKRFYSLGKTDKKRKLFLAFTVRKNLIRVISSKDMSKKEKNRYENYEKKIPKFKLEAEEKRFREKNDSSEYINWDKAELVILPKLKPTVKSISIRMPQIMLNQIKVIANKKDVPYQSFIKTILAERINQELHIAV